jgi:hypothetical protein
MDADGTVAFALATIDASSPDHRRRATALLIPNSELKVTPA